MTVSADLNASRGRAPAPGRYDLYALDIDGTVCLGDDLIATAGETIAGLRARGSRVIFLTNDATHSQVDHAQRLTRLGVDTSPEDVLTPIGVAVAVLQERAPNARVFIIGERSVADALAEGGFEHSSNPTEIDAVIVSHDRGFDYAKLSTALQALRAGAHLMATNADAYRPTPDGGEPGTGALLAAVERCSGAVAEIVGKPSVHMRSALRRMSVGANSCLMVGDQLDTDIAMGSEVGWDSALVLTGVTDSAMFSRSSIRPTFVVESLADLIR